MIELLPGFRVAADRVRGQMDDGVSTLIVRGESCDDPIASSVLRLFDLESHGVFVADSINPELGAAGLIASLVSKLDVVDGHGIRSVDTLLESQILEYRIVVADVVDVHTSHVWIDLLAEFGQLGSRVEPVRRPVFLVSVPFEASMSNPARASTSIVRLQPWRSIFSEADAIVAAAHLAAESPGSAIERALKSSVISAIAGVDLSLARFLGDYNIESFDKIAQLLDKHCRDNRLFHPYMEGGPAYATLNGGFRQSDGTYARHIHTLGSDSERDAEIKRRLWHAQVRILYPFLELKRRSLLDDNRARLSIPHRRPDGKSIEAVEDLEFGDIVHQLRYRNRDSLDSTIEQLDFLRETRNSLAHFQPVTFQFLLENRRWLS
jgi:hypothetical protein